MKIKPRKKKILVLDIETKPAIVYSWRLFNVNISNNQIKETDGILCIGAKWLGEKETFLFSEWEMGQKGMLEAILEMINEADGLITYNGDKFDLPHITTALMLNDMPAPAPVSHIDLYKFIRSKTKFISKKLGFVGPALGIGEKLKHSGFELWVDVMNGDKDAQKRMAQYCVEDVNLTERLYARIKGYITNHPNLGFHDPEACPACESTRTQRRGYYYTRMFRYQRHQCTNCGHWFKSKREGIKKAEEGDATDEG